MLMRLGKFWITLFGLSFLTGCGGGGSRPSVPLTFTITKLPSNYLTIPTYDGLVQETEPHVLNVPGRWNGYQYWMTAAPYPRGNNRYENASVWATNDPPGGKQKWQVPPGVTNPVTGSPPANLIYADQSLFLDDDGTMYLYFSETSLDLKNKAIYALSSKDGWKTVSKPLLLFNLSTSNYNPLISTVLKDPVKGYHLWQVDISTPAHTFYRWDATSPVGPFLNKRPCQVDGLHGDMTLFEHTLTPSTSGGRILALTTLAIPGHPFPGRGDTTLNFMSSEDGGLTWTVQNPPLIAKGAAGTWDSLQLYRGSLAPTTDPNVFDLWYSAADPSENWHVAYAQGKLGN